MRRAAHLRNFNCGTLRCAQYARSGQPHSRSVVGTADSSSHACRTIETDSMTSARHQPLGLTKQTILNFPTLISKHGEVRLVHLTPQHDRRPICGTCTTGCFTRNYTDSGQLARTSNEGHARSGSKPTGLWRVSNEAKEDTQRPVAETYAAIVFECAPRTSL